MASKSVRFIERSRSRHISFHGDGDGLETRRPTLIGKARAISVQDTVIAEPSETDMLLHQSHGLVAQLREAVGRPRLDL